MRPTQAQIEAAQLAKWIKELKWKSIDKDNMEFEVRTTCYVRDALLKWVALTAAAEAGDDCVSEIDRKGAELAAAHIKDTIERCAQVTHDWLKHHGYEIEAIECAAALRAMDQNNVR